MECACCTLLQYRGYDIEARKLSADAKRAG